MITYEVTAKLMCGRCGYVCKAEVVTKHVTPHIGRPNFSKARDLAKVEGWSVRIGVGGSVALCPACSRKRR